MSMYYKLHGYKEKNMFVGTVPTVVDKCFHRTGMIGNWSYGGRNPDYLLITDWVSRAICTACYEACNDFPG